ncbi:hypothetical protein ACFOUP_00170 [Belliella kenyensis]|uniref:Anti-sigma factor n=1 Tax=Belliella kenyensis TaxID=1472724 RepID=A0ABV8EFI9_9BACT|nr:hypothetical protein [Belliella kenyensis]MCH7401898.1 hypothetical protein [Belliella kenyensis]MDN3604398.1 hypothetical protein [Belliella kenyensis]
MINNIPKENIYKVPESYFDKLSEDILAKNKERNTKMIWMRSMAASVAILVSVGLYVFNNGVANPETFQDKVNSDINLYINSGYWSAEDALSLTDNPNDILDQIIAEEWSSYSNADLEDEFWY